MAGDFSFDLFKLNSKESGYKVVVDISTVHTSALDDPIKYEHEEGEKKKMEINGRWKASRYGFSNHCPCACLIRLHFNQNYISY